MIKYLGRMSVALPKEIMGQACATVVELIAALVKLGFLLHYGKYVLAPVPGYRRKFTLYVFSGPAALKGQNSS